MENIEDMILRWHTDDDMTDEEVTYCEEHLTKSLHNDEVHDHKWVTWSSVYKHTITGKFYKAWVQNVDDGYWGDGEKVSSGCFEVVPKEITSTIYIAKEK